jgi:hypothetical protein
VTALGEAAEAAIQGAGEVTVEDESGRRATLRVRDADRLAVELEGIEVHAPADLGDRAGHLARELRPGGERLRAFEVDPRLGGATLRTRPEDIRGGRFFEVDVRPEGTRLRRLRVDDYGGRTAEGFTVTREQLGRLVDTLAADPETD